MTRLSEWLELMLAEIARKRDEEECGRREEQLRREAERESRESDDGPPATRR